MDLYSIIAVRSDGTRSTELMFTNYADAIKWADWLIDERDARQGLIIRIIVTDGVALHYEWRHRTARSR